MPEKENGIELFENRKIRSVWDEEREEWYFSVVDVVEALTDSANPTDYLKKMRKRDAELAAYLGTNCPQVGMLTATGKKRKTLKELSNHGHRIENRQKPNHVQRPLQRHEARARRPQMAPSPRLPLPPPRENAARSSRHCPAEVQNRRLRQRLLLAPTRRLQKSDRSGDRQRKMACEVRGQRSARQSAMGTSDALGLACRRPVAMSNRGRQFRANSGRILRHRAVGCSLTELSKYVSIFNWERILRGQTQFKQ